MEGIDDAHLMTGAAQLVDDLRTDEPDATGHEDPRTRSSVTDRVERE